VLVAEDGELETPDYELVFAVSDTFRGLHGLPNSRDPRDSRALRDPQDAGALPGSNVAREVRA